MLPAVMTVSCHSHPTSVNRWFIDDTDYPAHYEPSGADFLSAALCEAELVSRLLAP